MSNYARTGKRMMSALCDLLLVIVATLLLYLFPFQLIINKAVDSDYKNNVKKPYDSVVEKYSGTVSYFGTSTDGLYGELTKLFDSKTNLLTVNKDQLDKYRGYRDETFTNALSVSNDIQNMIDTEYNADQQESESFRARMYQLYYYADYAYQLLNTYPYGDSYVSLESQKANGEITESEYNSKVNEYKTTLNNEYISVLKAQTKAFNTYNTKYSDSRALTTAAYSYITNKLSTLKEKADTGEYTATDQTNIVNFLNRYRDWSINKTAVDTEPTGDETVKINKEGYNVFVYGLLSNQENEKSAYIEKYTVHTTWVVAYALSMFTVIFSLYTLLMRGYTLGRRLCKIQLVGKNPNKKVNPILALIHDVPLQYLYVLVLGLYSLTVAGIVYAVFTILDVIMIMLKPHKAIRDYITMTQMVEVSSYSYSSSYQSKEEKKEDEEVQSANPEDYL